MNTADLIIAGRRYILHLDYRNITNGDGTVWARSYRVTGTRGAEGAITVHLSPNYCGRAISVGIAALDRVSWWDMVKAMAPHDEVCYALSVDPG